MELSEKLKKTMSEAAKYINEHPEEIRLAMQMHFLKMGEDFKKRFDALPRDKQLKLMNKLYELEEEDSGK